MNGEGEADGPRIRRGSSPRHLLDVRSGSLECRLENACSHVVGEWAESRWANLKFKLPFYGIVTDSRLGRGHILNLKVCRHAQVLGQFLCIEFKLLRELRCKNQVHNEVDVPRADSRARFLHEDSRENLLELLLKVRGSGIERDWVGRVRVIDQPELPARDVVRQSDTAPLWLHLGPLCAGFDVSQRRDTGCDIVQIHTRNTVEARIIQNVLFT